MALLGVKREKRPAIVALGLFGAALIYGDGAITPAGCAAMTSGPRSVTARLTPR